MLTALNLYLFLSREKVKRERVCVCVCMNGYMYLYIYARTARIIVRTPFYNLLSLLLFGFGGEETFFFFKSGSELANGYVRDIIKSNDLNCYSSLAVNKLCSSSIQRSLFLFKKNIIMVKVLMSSRAALVGVAVSSLVLCAAVGAAADDQSDYTCTFNKSMVADVNACSMACSCAAPNATDTTPKDKSENRGIAYALVIAAGLSTTIGAAAVFWKSCVVLTNTRVLSLSLGFSAGVMMYVSFVEIFVKSVEHFENCDCLWNSKSAAYVMGSILFFAAWQSLTPSMPLCMPCWGQSTPTLSTWTSILPQILPRMKTASR